MADDAFLSFPDCLPHSSIGTSLSILQNACFQSHNGTGFLTDCLTVFLIALVHSNPSTTGI